MSDSNPVRDLLGPAADLPAPPSPDDRTDDAEDTGGVIPGTGRRAEDHVSLPDTDAGVDG
jgi:hypothetical protein